MYGRNTHRKARNHFHVLVKVSSRNFASKANLLKHLKSKHDIDLPKHKRILALKIEAHGEKQEKYIIPKSQNQIIQLLFDKYINKKKYSSVYKTIIIRKVRYLN